MSKPAKLFLPILDNGNGDVKGNYMLSFLAGFAGRDVQVHRANDSLPSRGRNTVAASFLASDCDEMLFIDADIIFTKEHIDKLCEHDVPLVCGIYPKRKVELELCLCTFPDYYPDPNATLVEVRRSGTGMMRIKRELLERLKQENGGPCRSYMNHGRKEWDFFPVGVVDGDMAATDGGEYLSEDWYFCELCRSIGVPVLVDQRVQVKHEGGCVFPVQTKTSFEYHELIPGWFDYQDVYRRIAGLIPRNGVFVEVGCFLGRSLAAFAQYCRESGKSPTFHAVDTFKGSKSEGCHKEIVGKRNGSLRPEFEANMRDAGLNGDLVIHEQTSVSAANEIPDGGADAVFIDAEHTYDAVSNDITAWLPKVKSGGILAGHGYDYEDVKRAVSETLSGAGDVKTMGRCWYLEKP